LLDDTFINAVFNSRHCLKADRLNAFAGQQDTALVHQHEHQNPEVGQQNYIYELHNAGLQASGSVEVYVANASTGLSWPSDWSLVSSTAIASFPQQSTRTVEMPWTPSGAGHYCILARWISAGDPMTTPETTNIEANTRGNNNVIWRNVHIVDLVKDSSDTAQVTVRNVDEMAMKTSLPCSLSLRWSVRWSAMRIFWVM
jgi:hypothetical protein